MEKKPFALGRTAEIYAWENDTVLKLFFDWVSAESIAYEAHIHRIVQEHFTEIPKLLGEIELDGRNGLIFERIEGPNMRDEMLGHLIKAPKLVQEFAELQTALHKFEIPEFETVKTRLRRNIQQNDIFSLNQKTDFMQRLDNLPDKENLLHFDFHPGQIIYSPDGPVTIDWVTAGHGDPAAGVARTIVLIKFFTAPPGSFLKRIGTNLFVRWYCWAYPRKMRRLNPEITLDAVQAWMVPIAAARLIENIPGEKEKILAWLRKQDL